MLKIKELKHGQVFYAMDNDGQDYSFKAWGEPSFVNGVWTIEAEDRGNYSYTFTENDETILFLTDSLAEQE